MLTPRQSRYLIAALIFATAIKLYLALFTHGSTDVDGFADHLLKVRELGVGAYYVRGPFDNPFNSPPAAIHWIKALGFLADLTGLPFRFWLRLFPTIAGIGSLFIVWRFLRDRQDLFPLLIALALCPVSIMVDGYHGNTDSVVIMFVLLSIYLIERRSLMWLAGIAFGLACCIKVVPLMFVPAFIWYFRDATERVKFSVAAISTFALLSLPYIAQDPIAVKNVVFGYGSMYGTWGFPQFLAIFFTIQYAHQPFEPLGVHAVIAATLKYITLALILAGAWWMNRSDEKPSLYIQCGIVTALFLLLTPGFGPQYLVWFVPFVPALGLRATLTYYIPASLFLFCKYAGLVDNSLFIFPTFAFGMLSWLFLLSMLNEYRHLLTRRQTERRVLVVEVGMDCVPPLG